jgi:hypothetical protein
MGLPLADQYQTRVTAFSTDAAIDGAILPADPTRAVLIVCNTSNAKVAKISIPGFGQAAHVMFVQIQDQITIEYRTHGLLVTGPINFIANGFVEALTLYELLWRG